MKYRQKSILLAVCAMLCLLASIAEAATPILGVHPVLMADDAGLALLVGGVVNDKWASAGRIAQYVRESQPYTLYNELKCVGKITGSKPVKKNGQCYVVKHSTPITNFKIGVAGDWDALPRISREDSVSNEDSVKAVRKMLDGKKLKRSAVNITQAFCVDINGDGKTQTVICAESKSYNIKLRAAGEYSMVLLCVSGENYLIKGEFHLASRKNSYPESYRIAGIWDIDGDGTLEIGVALLIPKADANGIAFYDLSGNKPKLLSQAIRMH